MPGSTRKTQKNLYLSVDVCEPLEDDDRPQNEVVEGLLREEYDL